MDRIQRIAGPMAESGGILPLVEIAGDRRVLIEHHQGVVAYGPGEICVRVRFGQVRILGSNLCIAKMSAEQLVIRGCVSGVELRKNGGKGNER